ncbi:MAG TPA: glycerophosphoryl diester phosphodiesterase membrane domain-containing protein [Candidatus Angelobacter sp.]|jgi:hypothetical protein|nr:glycerophosphoryl diester phosphodiesterase membrane domain-containing protein [Candidatus Angelobacter sp.]
MDFTLRPMTIAEVLDRVFYLYRKNFVLFAGIAILPTGLALVVRLFQLAVGGVPTLGRGGISTDAMMASAGGGILIVLVYLIGGSLASAATVYALSMVHLGKTATIGESYRYVSPNIGRLVLIGILLALMFAGIGLAIVLSTFAGAVIPFIGILLSFGSLAIGIFFIVHLYARFSLAIPACVLEKTSAVKSLERSSFLTKGRTGRMWLVFLLTAIINFALGFAIALPVSILAGLSAVKGQMPFGLLVALQVAEFLAGTLAAPITTISIGLLYYDERIRKEAFDLQYMMAAMGQPGQQQAATSGL